MGQTWYRRKPSDNKRIAYVNARLIDPETGMDEEGSLLTEGTKIVDLGGKLFVDGIPEGIEVVDCKGHVLCPGLIDIQVHFREPGQTKKETIETGSKSAAAGGITRVVCQPNTSPVIDSIPMIEFFKNRVQETSYVHAHIYPCISVGMKGEQLTDMCKLVDAGAVGFTDDGLPIMNANLMRRAFSYSKMLGVPIVQHAEDLNLSQGGCMNEGDVSFKLGVRGIPNSSEAVIVARDLLLLEQEGGKYHVLHVSTREALEAIRHAKSKGLAVTCEVAPHHFTLTDEALLGYNTNAKMNPPLRSERDRQALIKGLKDGTIDAIATDHAPHDKESKQVPLEKAAFGIVGLEAMLPLSLALYHNGTMPLRDVLACMTHKAASIINVSAGRLRVGADADLTLIDLDYEWTMFNKDLSSKSHNSPFDGMKVKGRALRTVIEGQAVYEYEA